MDAIKSIGCKMQVCTETGDISVILTIYFHSSGH